MKLNLVQVDRNSVKPPPAVEETYRGVAAPSRPKVNAEADVAEMPKVRPCCTLRPKLFDRGLSHADPDAL